MHTPDRERVPFVLLRTKFQRPRLREQLVPRPRLLDQLHAGLRQSGFPESGSQVSLGFDRKLILVSAPAGYGKKTALGQWLKECPYPSSWLSLNDENSDLSIFLTYISGAIQTIYPNACRLTSSLLKSDQMLSQDYLASTLSNELADMPGLLVLVLDDYHRIKGEDVPKLVTALLDHLPPQVCLVIATRQNPDLPLIRLRASGEMFELRVADLCFTPDEVRAFLELTVAEELSDEMVEALDERMEGWIVGLQLAALSLRSAEDPILFMNAFQASRYRYVME